MEGGHRPLVLQPPKDHSQPNLMHRNKKLAIISMIVFIGLVSLTSILMIKRSKRDKDPPSSVPLIVVDDQGRPIKVVRTKKEEDEEEEKNRSSPALSGVFYTVCFIYVIVLITEFKRGFGNAEVFNAATRVGVVLFIVLVSLTIVGLASGTKTIALVGAPLILVGIVRYLSKRVAGYEFSEEGLQQFYERSLFSRVKQYGNSLSTAEQQGKDDIENATKIGDVTRVDNPQ